MISSARRAAREISLPHQFPAGLNFWVRMSPGVSPAVWPLISNTWICRVLKSLCWGAGALFWSPGALQTKPVTLAVLRAQGSANHFLLCAEI